MNLYKAHLNLKSINNLSLVKTMNKLSLIKAVPLQARRGPEGSRKLRFPDFVTTAQNGGKVVSLTHRPPFTPTRYSWHSFLLEAESILGPYCDRKNFM